MPDCVDVFGLTDAHDIFLIGGGGKTSLMFRLARDFVARRNTVITTTTTRIVEPDHSPVVIVPPDLDAAESVLRTALNSAPQVTAAAARLDNNKLAGISTDLVDNLLDKRIVDNIVIEADGSAGRSLKAHESHEPVVSARASLVIVVIGIDCVGAPLNDDTVHRAGLFSRRVGRPMGATITAEDVAHIVLSEQGYLTKVPSSSRVVVFLNKVTPGDSYEQALVCAEALRRADRNHRLERIAAGSLHGPGACRADCWLIRRAK